MNTSDSLSIIHAALEKATGKSIEINLDMDLFAEKILDSLDAMVFFLNVEELSGLKLPEGDLTAAGFSKVSTLISFLENSGKAP